MSILTADGIVLSYGQKKVLSDIYIKLETGKVIGVLGRNGSGKSSLLKVIFGILQAESQSIIVDDKRGIKPYMCKGLMSFLAQDDFVPGILRVKTVLKLFGVEQAHIVADFPAFAKLMNERVKNLSGGERRLLETYVVIKRDVKFVLLDEPFSFLMPLHIEKLKEIIAIEKMRKCIVITDHMYHEVEQMSDVLYLIDDGKSYKIESRSQLVEHGYLNRDL